MKRFFVVFVCLTVLLGLLAFGNAESITNATWRNGATSSKSISNSFTKNNHDITVSVNVTSYSATSNSDSVNIYFRDSSGRVWSSTANVDSYGTYNLTYFTDFYGDTYRLVGEPRSNEDYISFSGTFSK